MRKISKEALNHRCFFLVLTYYVHYKYKYFVLVTMFKPFYNPSQGLLRGNGTIFHPLKFGGGVIYVKIIYDGLISYNRVN